MMSSASATGTQQIYSQGSPFPAGHSGKAFRYVLGSGQGLRVPAGLCVCDYCLQALGQAEGAGGLGSVREKGLS